MSDELAQAIQGMGLYASSAKATDASWTNFFDGQGRPQTRDPAAVQAYVAQALKAQLCDPSLATEAASKSTLQGRLKAMNNIAALRVQAVRLLTPLKAITADQLKCE